MFEKIIEKLNKAESVGIAVHINPDGDALGSAFSLKNVLESMNKTANVYFCGGVESCLKEIFGIDEDYVCLLYTSPSLIFQDPLRIPNVFRYTCCRQENAFYLCSK